MRTSWLASGMGDMQACPVAFLMPKPGVQSEEAPSFKAGAASCSVGGMIKSAAAWGGGTGEEDALDVPTACELAGTKPEKDRLLL